MGAPQWTSGEILQLRALARTHTQAEAAVAERGQATLFELEAAD